MRVGDWTKLITLIIVDVGIFLLILFGSIEGAVGIPIVAASLGYVFGNGHAVIQQNVIEKTKINQNE